MSVSGTPTSKVEADRRDPASAVGDSSPVPPSEPSRRSPRPSMTWRVGGLDPQLVKALTVAGFAIPVIGYLALIGHYGVNAIWADQWDNVPVIRQSFLHFPDWSSLWSQHADNRILFPNLIVVVLAHTVHFNIVVEEYLSALLLFAATALFIWSHERRSPDTPLLFYCPVVLLTLTFAQWQNTLWGFQMAWYLVVFSLALTVALVDRPTLTWPTLLAAALVGVVCSYSSVQGLLVWPVGLVLLYHRRRPPWSFVAWVAAAGATAGLYFYHLASSQASNPQYVLESPYRSVQFFVYALGDVVGMPLGLHQSSNGGVMALGVLILVMAVFVLLRWGIRRDDQSGASIGIALIVFGLLFDALITEGRIFLGFFGASQSRYTTNDVMVLAGIYMTVIGGSPSRVRAKNGVKVPDTEKRLHPAVAWTRARGERIDDVLRPIDRGVIRRVALLAIVVQVVFSVYFGIANARVMHQYYVTAAHVTRNINHERDSTVVVDLYFVESAKWIRDQERFLKEHHLSLFG